MMPVDQCAREITGSPARIARLRLEGRLEQAAGRICLVVGSAGAGKSELVRACTDADAIAFRAGNSCRTLARFVAGLAAAISPDAYAAFPLAWERALQSRAPDRTLAESIADILAGSDRNLVIDDLYASDNLDIASFLATLAERRPAAGLVIAARSPGALPIGMWQSTGRLRTVIDEAALRFDRAEVVEAATRVGVRLDTATLDALMCETAGFPAAVAYVLLALRTDPHAYSHVPMPASFDEIARAVFARRSSTERVFLLSASLFPSVDDELLRLSGWDDAPALRAAMGADAEIVWEHVSERRVRLHDRFRDYLAHELSERDDEVQSTIAQRTIESLRRAGRPAEALDVATHQRVYAAIGELLEAHGFELLESGRFDVLSEALEAFAAPDDFMGPSALALRGYFEARSGRSDTAEAWFRLSLANVTDEATSAKIAMYYARELALRRREDSCDVLAALAESTKLPPALLVDVRSAFAQALIAANRFDEAALRTNEALALLDDRSSPALRARVGARAAFVALECGDAFLARERARVAAPIAEQECLYDVAASAYSVLYNIAYEIDDDAEASREYLRRVRELGKRAANVRLDLYALIGLYGLAAEAGDDDTLRDLLRSIAAADKHDAGVEIVEGLLPAKALQAAWTGDFAAAENLVRPTTERQATPARKALSWANVALFAAGARRREAANEAAAHALEALGHDELRRSAGHVTKAALTLLTLSLAAWAGGRIERGREYAAAADELQYGPAPRLRALRDVVACFLTDHANHDAFAAAASPVIMQLRSANFGGLARVIEALPAVDRAPHGADETVGSVVARYELTARFSGAAQAGDAGALRRWLDTLPHTTLRRMALPERFDEWAAARADSPVQQTTMANVRRQLAAYQRPAPGVLRLVDDVDASLDALFEHLDVAAPLMAEHSRAVSAWCARLARTLGLTQDEITFVSRCGLIHDIGKMRTPSAILNAPRQLSRDEWAIMQDHAAEGARIVSGTPVLGDFVPIVRGHHERLDGKGYPDGLRLSAIPLASRIVAVADCFNAMIGRRPYRLPLSPTAALGELERHRETQFDPEIVAAMVRIVMGRLPDPSTIAGSAPVLQQTSLR